MKTLGISGYLRLALCLACSVSACSAVKAQFGGSRIRRPLNRPTVSPYVNLVGSQNSGSLAINYFGVTRPQQQFYSQQQTFNQRLNQVQNGFSRRFQNQGNLQGQNSNQPFSFRRYRFHATGHPTAFFTIGGVGGQGAGAGGLGGANGNSGIGAGSNFGGAGNNFFNGGQAGRNGGFSSGHSVQFGGSRGFQN